ncbi:MAG: serine/threonine protein kinase [Polyangiaceae bacterium]|nr:serine/threonine protein kinase [Polyangiaceae bacterium]
MTDRIGKYRIIAKLGQGGMATVYLSVVPGPAGVNKLLVVKLLKEDLAQDADFLSMFVNEARLAARLNHANVVTTYEVGLDAGQHFLAMEYLDGQPLNTILRKTKRVELPIEIHVRILADALAGLDYAHTLKDFDGTPLSVVHRDVSPQNIFVTYDGQVKVVDFGIAKAAGAASTTQSGVFKGKLSYIAPEQASGRPVDARADVFSVGVMLWEAIGGRRFLEAEAQSVILARRIAGTEPRIRDVVPDADAELADICDKAMAHDPENRFRSALAFQDALEGYLDRFSKRVGPREVSGLVSNLFNPERESIRIVIDEQLKQVQRESSSILPMPSLDMSAPSSVDHTRLTTVQPSIERKAALSAPPPGAPAAADSGPGSLSGNGSLQAATMPASVGEPTVASRGASKSRTLLMVLGALALASVAGIAIVIATKKPEGSAAAATSAPKTERIELKIEYGPPGAVAKLDGVELAGSPFVAQVERDGTMHKIEVEAPGMTPKTAMISYEKDVSLALVLEAAIAPSASAAESAASAAPVPSAGPAVDPAKRPWGRVPDAGKPDKPPQRGIDEQDPYK